MRNLSKHLLALLCAALCLTACAEKEAAAPTLAANTTYTGTISALSLTQLTVQTEDAALTVPLTENTVFTRDFDADNLQPPQNGDDFVGGDMGTLPEGDLPNEPIGGELPPDGNFGGMGMPNGNGGMGGMGDPFLGEASIYDLTLGMHVTVTTDEKSQVVSVVYTQNKIMP